MRIQFDEVGCDWSFIMPLGDNVPREDAEAFCAELNRALLTVRVAHGDKTDVLESPLIRVID